MSIYQNEVLKINYRNDSSDMKAITEVIEKKSYLRRDFVYKENETWLDLGANIGTFSVLIAPYVKEIFAYEPDPASFAILQMNIKENKLGDKVKCFNVAVTNTDKRELSFFTNNDSGSHWRNSAYLKFKNSEKIIVDNKHYKDVLKEFKDQDINVKMDIEGAEIPILLEIDFAEFPNIKKLVFEWSFDVEPELKYYHNVIGKLRRAFPYLKHSKFKGDVWLASWFPPCTIVFCQRG